KYTVNEWSRRIKTLLSWHFIHIVDVQGLWVIQVPNDNEGSRVSVKRGASVACGLPLANWADARKERVRAEEPCRRIHSCFGEIFLRTPPSAAAQEREPSLRVLPTGHQVLLVESLDEIGTHVLA